LILAAARWTRLPSFNLWVTDALATTTWAITITRPETTSKKSFRSPLWGGLSLRRSVPTEAESYDLVMLNDVIEHLHDSPRELLNDLIILIKPGGYLLITVPNLAQHPQASRSSVGKDQPCPLPFVLLVARPLAGSRERICQGGFGVLGAVSGSTPGRTQELSPYDLSVAGGGAPCLSSGDLPVPRLARFMVAAGPQGFRVGAPKEPAPPKNGRPWRARWESLALGKTPSRRSSRARRRARMSPVLADCGD